VIRMPFAFLLADRWQADAIWWSFPLGAGASALPDVAVLPLRQLAKRAHAAAGAHGGGVISG